MFGMRKVKTSNNRRECDARRPVRARVRVERAVRRRAAARARDVCGRELAVDGQHHRRGGGGGRVIALLELFELFQEAIVRVNVGTSCVECG